MNNFIKKSALIVLIMIGGTFSLSAQAENKIDVEYPVGTNLNGGKIFSEDNIYPGWSKSKLIRVGNKSETDSVDLYLTFDAKTPTKLAEKLKIYVIRQSDGSYRIGGTGDHWTLKQADEKRLWIDRLDPNDGKQYKIKIKFDEEAGNEYQGLKAKFNIEFRIDAEETTGGGNNTPQEILANQGRGTFTGTAPAGETTEVAGEEAGNKEEGENNQEQGVKGEESQGETKGAMTGICRHWPWWVWLLAAVVYGGVLQMGIRKVKE